MCLAIPGKIVSLESGSGIIKTARVDFGGIIKEICIDWTPDVKINDYVLVHAGFSINKVNEEEAKETLNAINSLNELL